MRLLTKPEDRTIKQMEELLKVTSDFTRLKIMYSLLDDSKCECNCSDCASCKHLHCMIEKCVSEIYKEINASQSLVSHQLRVLKEASLVKVRKEGTKIYYSLSDSHIKVLLKIVYEHIMEGRVND